MGPVRSEVPVAGDAAKQPASQSVLRRDPAGAALGGNHPRGQLLCPYPQFLGVSSANANYGESSYNAMLLRIEHRMSKGLSLVAAYTLSKLIDDMLPAVNGFPGESFSGAPLQNFYDIRSERALASWDTPQTLVLSYVYELPFGRGKHFLTQGGPFGKIVGGWQINGNTTFQSGFPFQVNGGNGSGSFAGTQRPNRSGKDATLSGPVTDHLLRYFDTTVFSFNAPFTFGNAPRLMPTPAESRVRQLRYVGVQEPASHVAAGRANKDSNCWRDKARDWESIGSAQKSVASTIWGEV